MLNVLLMSKHRDISLRQSGFLDILQLLDATYVDIKLSDVLQKQLRPAQVILMSTLSI